MREGDIFIYMFESLKYLKPTYLGDSQLDSYHRKQSIFDTEELLKSMAEDEAKENEAAALVSFTESQRPTEQPESFELYKEFAIEYFPRAGQYRIAAPQEDTQQTRWSSAQGLRDIGLEFKFYGDACNYIDRYLI
mgnify:FL=1